MANSTLKVTPSYNIETFDNAKREINMVTKNFDLAFKQNTHRGENNGGKMVSNTIILRDYLRKYPYTSTGMDEFIR